MATKTSRLLARSLREEPTVDEIYGATTLQILALEECNNALFPPSRQLRSAGYHVQAVFEETRIADAISAAENNHFLLLTAQDTCRPLRIPQVIEMLRRNGYRHRITYCIQGRVSPEIRSAYEILSVNRVLSVPVAARGSVHDVFAWLHERTAFRGSGTTILEV